MRFSSFRLFVVTAIVLLLSTPWLVMSVRSAVEGMQNTPILWIPAENDQRLQYEWFRANFQVPDTVVVSWPGCAIDDPRLAALTEALKPHDSSAESRRIRRAVDNVTSGYDAVERMTQGRSELSRPQALSRLREILVGSDERTSCAVVSLTRYGVNHPRESLDLITMLLRDRVGIEPEDAFLAGHSVERVAIDFLSQRTMQYFLLPSAIIVLLLARLCLGRWRLTLVLIGVAAYGELFVLALVGMTSATMNAVLIVMAPLVFVLTVSAGVHLVNYYRDQVHHGGVHGAVGRALRAGWVPCSLAAVTTASGLVSLVVSEMSPVRQFGALSAIGVLVTTGLLFLMLPGPMRAWGAGPTTLPRNSEEGPKLVAPWERLARFVNRQSYLLSVIAFLLIVAATLGLAHVRTSVNVLSLLGPESRVADDYRWLEDNLAPMIPIEVILRMSPSDDVDWLDRMNLLRAVQYQLEDFEALGGTMSAATFVPQIPAGSGIRATMRRTVVREQIQGQLPRLQENGYLYQTDQLIALRITTRAPATREVDYGQLLSAMQQRIDPVLDRFRQQTEVEIEAVYTGMTPLIHVAQQILLDDLFKSFLTALCLVAVVIIFVLRSIPAGLIAMVPNVFPVAVLFGSMGWLGIPVDIGSMMTASVAIGIAIDGTLHFLIWYRRETSRGMTPVQAVTRAYSHCGTALWQTAIICGLGLLVFALSHFVPTRRFAWMMLLLLLLAAVGDLILLPALLLGPVRGMFARSPATTTDLDA